MTDILVSATELMRELSRQVVTDDLHGTGVQDGLNRAVKLLANAVAVDSAPVIRCEQCDYYDAGFCFSRAVGCGCVTPPRKPDDFCSYGERRAAL